MERRKARRLTQKPNKQWFDTDRNRINTTNLQEKNQTNTSINPNTSQGFLEAKPQANQSENAPANSQAWRGGRRSYAEGLVERAAWLPAEDRALIEGVYGEGLSVAAYVRRCRDRGVGPETISCPSAARAARRRVRRLIERIMSDRFGFVTARRNTWPTTRRRVALACIVHGLSLREASKTLGLSLHTVRRHMEAVDALFTEHVIAGKQAREAVRDAARTSSARRDGDKPWSG